MIYLFKHLWVIGIFSITLIHLSSAVAWPAHTCRDIVLQVTVTANNTYIPEDLSLSDPETLASALANVAFIVPTDGTFNIAATYCEPAISDSLHSGSLQLLVHGGTYTRSYWSGDIGPVYGYDGSRYSWVAYALSQGYSTLAIDRLGNGQSDHPDPTTIVQMPVHVEVIHEIILAAKAGSAPLPRCFRKVVYAGHSIGSLIGNMLNTKYPDDVDATILTGFTNELTGAIGGVIMNAAPHPAGTVQSDRFGSLPPGYLELSSEKGTQFAFYNRGGYDINLFYYDYSIRGTVTIGEIITLFFSINPAPAYTAPVYVVTGQHDALFCNPTGNFEDEPNCGFYDTGYVAQARSLYPSTGTYEWYLPPHSGHCWQLHYDALFTFGIIHAWLEKVDFGRV